MTEEPEDRSAPSGHSVSAGSSVISVMLIVADAAAAVSWYQTALGATELWNLGGVAGLEIGGVPFPARGQPREPCGAQSRPDGHNQYAHRGFVDDPYDLIERAVATGATAGSRVDNHSVPWEVHRQNGFIDPLGHKWPLGDRSPLGPFRR
jgi:PhnB protein